MNKQTFLKEYEGLRKKFPQPPQIGFGNENCDYCDNIFKGSKDCYYVFESAEMNECMYCSDGYKETNDVDCEFGLNGEGNCECIDFADTHSCYGCASVARSYNLWFCYNCVDCHDCYGCTNLSHKSYCIGNIQYTKEEYESKLPILKKQTIKEARDNLNLLIKKFPQVHSEQIDTTNSEYCDYSYFNNNCYYCFDSANNNDSGYLTASYECKDVWDSKYSVRGENSLNILHSGDVYNCYEASDCNRCYDCYFVEDCIDCHDCFGCVKLEHKQYCILNVQYTKEEYFEKLLGLKKELGLVFSGNNNKTK